MATNESFNNILKSLESLTPNFVQNLPYEDLTKLKSLLACKEFMVSQAYSEQKMKRKTYSKK